MTISTQQVYQRNPNIVSSEIDNETVMMDENFESYFGLRTIGTEVWNLLENPINVDQIASELIQRYEVTAEQCVEDITPFMQDLLKNGMIVEA